MPEPGRGFQRLLIVGLPRSGTTLVATLLAAHPKVHFLTDYFAAFTEALHRLGKGWGGELNASERRIALALVRDQFLRARHPVLVKLDQFASLDELHRLVLAELVSGTEAWVGHKLLLAPELLRATLRDTDIRCLLLLRDPRDAALSYYHRTGGGVDRYVRNWRETVRLWQELEPHPRLLALRFEDLIGETQATLDRLGAWLGLTLDASLSSELQFQRSRAHGGIAWRENSAYQDVTARFDRRPVGRWRAQCDSPIVRYAGWATQSELAVLNYEPSPSLSLRERSGFHALRALEVGERHAHDSISNASRWLKRRLPTGGTREL